MSSSFSIVVARTPRTRPPRMTKCWTVAASSSSAMPKRSASVSGASTSALSIEHRVDRLEPVAVDRGRLVVHRGGCLPHPRRQLLRESLVAAGHERDEVVDDRAVLLDRDLHRARTAAAADLPGEARPAGRHRLLVAGVAAGADREDLDHEVDRVVDGPHLRIRAEVLRAGDPAVARDDDPRRLVRERDRHEGVGLVVLVAHVERRIELLDPHVLELERVHVRRDDGPFDGCRGRDHPPGALVQRPQRREVVRQAGAEVLRLADVQHAPGGVAEAVDAGVRRDLARPRPVGELVGHAVLGPAALSRPCARGLRRTGAERLGEERAGVAGLDARDLLGRAGRDDLARRPSRLRGRGR